jgi:phosphoadenosine phosphosulfate reductase
MPTETLEPPATIIDADSLNAEFELLTPSERIERSAELFAGRLVVASSFKPTAPYLLEQVRETAPELQIVTVRHHHESLKTLERTNWYKRNSGLRIDVHDAPVLQVPRSGSPAFAEFQRQVKIEPFQELLNKYQARAFISGVMRWQPGERAELPIVQRRGAILAINAIVDVSQEAVEEFCTGAGWSLDELYLDPTKGSDQKLECGLNTTIYRDKEE